MAAGHEAPVSLAGRELRPGALQERRVEAERRGLGIERRGHRRFFDRTRVPRVPPLKWVSKISKIGN